MRPERSSTWPAEGNRWATLRADADLTDHVFHRGVMTSSMGRHTCVKRDLRTHAYL